MVAIVQWVDGDQGDDATLPVAATPGNTLVFCLTHRDGAVFPVPTGFIQIANPINGGRSAGMYYRVVTSDESGVTVAGFVGRRYIVGDTSPDAVLIEISGAYAGIFASQTVGATTSILCGGAVVPTAASLIIGVAAIGQSDGDSGSMTPAAGVTELVDRPTGAGFSPRTWVGHRSDSSGSVTVGGTYSTSLSYCGVTAVFVDNVTPAGYDVYRINAPGTSITFLGTLTDAFDKAIRPVRNAPGSGKFSINRYSPNATAAMLAPGNLVKVRIPEIGTGYIFAFFMEKGDFKLVASDEQGGEIITIGGRGALAYWDRAIWLASKFVIPWWPSTMDTPPAGTKGAVQVAAGTYRRYTIAGGVITGYTNFTTTTGFSAYFDSAKTYQWPSANSKRYLAHLTTTEDPASPSRVGYYFHPHQSGVTKTLPSYALGSNVPLSTIGDGTKPGQVLERLYQEGISASRPVKPIPLAAIDFTATTDSTGAAWATTSALAGITAELGETYLDTIASVLGTNAIDVEMGPNLDFHAYNSRGRDLTSATFAAGKVRFVKGVNIADELSRERDDLPVATFIEVVGTENVVGQASLPDAATRVARETSATGDSNDEATLAAVGLADLNSRLIQSDAVGFRIVPGNNDAAGLYLPGPPGSTNGDFWVGDTVRVHTGTSEQDFNEQNLRVSAITIGEDDAGNLIVTPEVGSALGNSELALYRGSDRRTAATFATRSQFSDTEVAESAHPDLETHDGLGLATQAELDTHTHAATRYEPLTSGANSAPELVFTAAGRVIMVPVAD